MIPMYSGGRMQILPHKFEQQQSRLSFTFESFLTPSLNAIFFNTQNILDSSLKHYPYSEQTRFCTYTWMLRY